MEYAVVFTEILCRNVILLVKDPTSTMKLFQSAFGLKVLHESPQLVEMCSVGYNASKDPSIPQIILKVWCYNYDFIAARTFIMPSISPPRNLRM